MLDIVFCSIPYSNLDYIYSAPAILKGIVQSHGFRAKTKDFGLDLYTLCGNNFEKFTEIQTYFITPGKLLSTEHLKILDEFYNEICQFIEQNPAKIYSFSIFSVYTHKSGYEILQRIKQRFPDQRILIGGRGVKVTAYTATSPDLGLRGREKLLPYGEIIANRKLADYVIVGDGEDAIIELLGTGNISVENFQSETFEYPLPDYTDYQFDKYLNYESISLPITGSKGCVRDCDFCDVRYQFGKFRYRSGADVANEMIHVSKTYGFRKFQFTDSLVNGGLKPLEDFCSIVSQYNQDNPESKISWNGQYICRPKEHMPERLYSLMAASGAHGLTIGAESGSDRVLEAMNKKTTVGALLHELEMFRKYNITCFLLTMTGHWSETHEDFIEHCQMFVKILPYVRSGTVSAVSLGIPMMMLDSTPSQVNIDRNGVIVSDFDKESIWYVPNNPINTFKERAMRRLAVTQLCQLLKIPTVSDVEYILPIKNYVDTNYQKINNFYEKVI